VRTLSRPGAAPAPLTPGGSSGHLCHRHRRDERTDFPSRSAAVPGGHRSPHRASSMFIRDKRPPARAEGPSLAAAPLERPQRARVLGAVPRKTPRNGRSVRCRRSDRLMPNYHILGDLLMWAAQDPWGSSLSVDPGHGHGSCFSSSLIQDLFPRRESPYQPTVGELPGHEYLPCAAFATQMPLNRRRYSVPYSKSIHDLEPPYGIEP
jgi:hypothetical protein